MTLSADAIINGLTMLRAYGCIQSLATEPGAIFVHVSKPMAELHDDDIRRLQSEGWTWDAANGRWVL